MYARPILILCSVLAFFAAVPAQDAKPSPAPEPDEEVIKVESKLVVVPVSVLDVTGNPVKGLAVKDFSVREEGRRQEISEVTPADQVPLEIALLFDISASTGSMFDYQQETAARFLKEVMRAGDRATVFTIGNEVKIIAARQSAETAGAVIQRIRPTKEQTSFYDAVSAAAMFLRVNAPDGARKIILVISDGDDTNSAGVLRAIFEAEGRLVKGGMSTREIRELRVRARDAAKLTEQHKVLKALQDADAVFYAVNTLGASGQLNASTTFGQSNLDRFSGETGGSSHIPKFEPINLKEPIQNEYNLRKNQDLLSGIFRVIANELRSQYLVQYYSDAEFPRGRFVELKLELNGRPKERVKSRGGYFVK